MELIQLAQRVDRLSGFDALLSAFDGEAGHAQIDGLTGPAKSLVLARLHQLRSGKMLIITFQAEQAQRLWDDLRHFGVPDDQLCLLPSSENRWLSNDVTDFRIQGERIAALTRLGGSADCIVIGTAEAVFQRTSSPVELLSRSFVLNAKDTVSLDDLLHRLTDMAYESETTVSRPGQFSRRGGILDIYPSTAETPVRIELFGDEIESMRAFDVSSQRSIGGIDAALIAPMREVYLTTERVNSAVQQIRAKAAKRRQELAVSGNRATCDTLTTRIEHDLQRIQNGVYFDGLEEYFDVLVPKDICALDYLPREGGIPCTVVVDEPGQVRAHWERTRSDLNDSRERRKERGELLDGAAPLDSCANGLTRIGSQFSSLVINQLPRVYEGLPPGVRLSLSTAPMESYRAKLASFADEVKTWLANGAECLMVSDQPGRVREICAELNIPIAGTATVSADAAPALTVLEGRLRQGFKFADIGLYVATDAELFGTARAGAAPRRATGGIPISTILDLRENDYVVHVHHGIGVYRGLVKRQVDNTERDYLYIQYAGADRLYVPADQIDRVQRYIGGESSPPTINRIGGNEWERTTRRVKEQARDMAKDLIALYAARQSAERPTYGGDTLWQNEMEDAFPYEETPTQYRAIQDVKYDMEQNRPMDRLICGDVGFGKTEVAIRAAFKVVESGKQVAVLCPTTVLAAQHHTTFSERLAAYPIAVELLSRYRHKQAQKNTVECLKAGSVDIVIGTHRILSKDVEFKNLGLIIVDEEQRFGVAHKERLKQLRTSVDVLTLTATPIPRTLSMALSGLRDMSVIGDAPVGRLPIVTYVREYDDDLVRDAIMRELERDGQIYFVHNRIESIEYVAERVRRTVPDARIRIGHGQMSEDELEKIMYDFYHKEYDILLSTTIIENGLDIPNVNTIIVDNADKMGLAQLYQLRGRVGRSNRQAYAYLLYRPHKQLTEEAERRLIAIRDFTALGSGFQIAMRDLEIRGAGNLLGAEQSGAMISVGFDMYCQLLSQAVAEVKGEEPTEDILPAVDLPITAYIPDNYIPNEAERIYFYKKMSSIHSAADIEKLQEELDDRYGDPPKPVWAALAVLRLRLRAREAGIASIRGERTEVSMRFAPHARLSPEAIRLLTYTFKKRLRFTGDSIIIGLTTPKIMDEVEEMVSGIEKALIEGSTRRERTHTREW